jgi:2-polyprenyl-6-methoxyphenol hydroxylase-like FAD-dependent oxidoreductase
MAVPGYFRKPFGPGWALGGDAGYNKDFITAQGIQDVFRDAELCVGALDAAWSGRRAFPEAMAAYQAARDEHVLPMYELAADIASLEPPAPERQRILEAAQGNQEAMDGFTRVNAGVTSPREFFSEDNTRRILAARPLSTDVVSIRMAADRLQVTGPQEAGADGERDRADAVR